MWARVERFDYTKKAGPKPGFLNIQTSNVLTEATNRKSSKQRHAGKQHQRT